MEKEKKLTILELMDFVEESQRIHDMWLETLTQEQQDLYWVMMEDEVNPTIH